MRRIRSVLPLSALLLAIAPGASPQPPPVPFYQFVSFSPNGSELAFCAVVESWSTGYEMFVMPAAGGAARKLGPGIYPRFSPDGERIAFAHEGDLWVMGRTGSEPRRLTAGEGRDSYPAWSPDGGRIAFMSIRDGNYDVYSIAADGTDERRLTEDEAAEYNPDWSPDGTRIVYERHPEGEPTVLWLMSADGSERRSLGARCSFPAFSPDGAWIACGGLENADGVESLVLLRSDGSEQRRLADFAFQAAWAPDGKTLVLATSERDPERGRVNGIALIDADGGELRHLVRGELPND